MIYCYAGVCYLSSQLWFSAFAGGICLVTGGMSGHLPILAVLIVCQQTPIEGWKLTLLSCSFLAYIVFPHTPSFLLQRKSTLLLKIFLYFIGMYLSLYCNYCLLVKKKSYYSENLLFKLLMDRWSHPQFRRTCTMTMKSYSILF